MRVCEGTLVVEIEGIEHIVRPGDPELILRRGMNHRLYPRLEAARVKGTRRVRCVLSAEKTLNSFALDLVFFENWYAYQEQVVVHGAKPDPFQVMSVRIHIKDPLQIMILIDPGFLVS